MTRHDRRRIRRVVLELNARRLYDWWTTRGWWCQIMVAAALLCVFELLVIWAVRPYLLEAVTS